MADNAPHTAEHIEQLLETWLEVEFTFIQVGDLARAIAAMPRSEQDFLLGWIRRTATTNIQIAFQFAERAVNMMAHMDHRMIEAWLLHAMDTYDRSGQRPALKVIQEVERFTELSHEHAAGAVFEDISGILLNFLRGLSGRRLKLEQADSSYTDSETLYLPAVVARMQEAQDNFTLCKATVTMLWAQTRFGSFRVDPAQALQAYPNQEKALKVLHSLETLRLEACISRELPGLYREMQRLKRILGEDRLTPQWQAYAQQLSQPEASLQDSLALLPHAYGGSLLPALCYQGELRLDKVHEKMRARMDKEKILLRVKLAQLAEELKKQTGAPEQDKEPRFAVKHDEADSLGFELTLNDLPITPPEDVRQLLTSIQLDWGAIPPEYLTPAGDGEYDPSLYEERTVDPDAVWQGTYHEEGATLYPEWDFGRQLFRKNWCVMREKDVLPARDDFIAVTREKYSGLIKHLRRTFEAMRDEDQLLKRQSAGDEVDIDALVEALADAQDGREMSDRLFMHMHRAERNIAVMFMVDMSGSTRGWINEAERESLVLLCETLELLGDRYAIYGFSGTTRKRCELYRVKRFGEPYDDDVRARISGIRPQDYTRMGFAIRHLTKLLNAVEARTKLLITLSDGKPDDYHDGYRGQYGIEDTRHALVEAKRAGIHPFCITIDTEGRDYLPHMYGPANYVVIDEVRKLPLKVADIYRRLTT